MKRFLPCCIFLVFLQFVTAQGFEVEKADIHISINKEGYFDVRESYDVVFSESRHGIYRNIQLVYDLQDEQGKREKRRVKISKIKVPGHKYETDAFFQKIQDELEIKIGNPKETVIGDQHYDINYRVKNAFLHESEGTQFYWNIIPPNWKTTFDQVDFTIELPKDLPLLEDDVFVYSGSTGITTESEWFDVEVQNDLVTVRSKPGFESGFGESVTVLIKMPKDAVKEI